MVNVKDYGAKGDGITNDRTAIVTAINIAIASEGIVYFPSGTYNITSNITFNLTDKRIAITGSGNTIIAGSNISISFISYKSTTEETFSVVPTKGSTTITLDNVDPLTSAGDILQIESTDEYINLGISNVHKGEMAVVQKVSGKTITLNKMLFDDYAIATTVVRRLKPGGIYIDGIKFENTSIGLTNLSYSTVRNCTFLSGDIGEIVVTDCYDLTLDHLTIIKNETYTGSGSYGIGVGSTQNILITNCTLNNAGQGIVIGGETHPTRNILVAFNTLTHGNMDSHAQTEYVNFSHNRLFNATIYAKGSYVNIESNEISYDDHYTGAGIIRLREDLTNTPHNIISTQYENIINNRVFCLTDSVKNEVTGINIHFNCYNDTVDYINISGNYVNVGGYGLLIAADGAQNVYVRHMNVNNNYIRNYESVGEGSQLYTIYHSAVNITFKEIVYSNNIIISSYWDAVYCRNSGSIGTIKIINNRFEGGRSYFVNSTNTILENNTFDHSLLLAYGTDDLKIINNTFIGAASNSISNGGGVPPTSVLVRNNIYTDAGSVENTYTAFPTAIIVDETRYLSGALTDGNPSNSEVNSICGSTAALLYKGYKLIIKDSDGTGLTYIFISDGTNWILQGMPVKIV